MIGPWFALRAGFLAAAALATAARLAGANPEGRFWLGVSWGRHARWESGSTH